jgi:serine/threonine-protein kinase
MPIDRFDDLSGRPDPSREKIGPFELLAELAWGDMTVTYKARDPLLGRLVALKTVTPEALIDPESLQRFYREAQVGAVLHHPNLVTIYELREADGRPYFVMEWLEGECLQSIIRRYVRIPLAAKLKLIQQLCEAFRHVHRHGFVLCIVDPENIMVTNEGIVKVMDFSTVHLQTADPTRTTTFMGNILLPSPEQIKESRIDIRGNIWSVTCVMYEFIACKKPFEGSNIATIISKILNAEPVPLSICCPGVPAEMDKVISKGLKKNPDERYPSLDALLADLLPIARSLQQRFVDDLVQEAKDLRDKGDLTGAQEKLGTVLILANTHEEAQRLYVEISAKIPRPG